MWDLLPGSGTLAGWSLVPGAERKAGTTAGLYGMYDGAVPDMQAAGVTAAGQRIYTRDSRRLSVDLLRFTSADRAKAYYVRRKAEISKASTFGGLTGIRDAGCCASISRSSVAYLWCRSYYASLTINGNTAADRATLRAFAQHISTRVAPPQKPR
jgi:hypothetical protein